MFSVQVGTLLQRDEELTGVGMFAAVCHGKEAGVCVATHKILVFEVPFWIDRVTASAVTFREIATLAHKALNHSVDLRAQIVQLGAGGGTKAFLTGAKRSEVFSRQWRNIRKELKGYSAHILRSDSELEENTRLFTSSNALPT